MSDELKMYTQRIQEMELNELDNMLSNIDEDVSYGYLTCAEGKYLLKRVEFQYKILLNKRWGYNEEEEGNAQN